MEHFAYCKHFILIINFELSLFSGCAGTMDRGRDPLEKWREQNGSHSCEKFVNMRLWRAELITDVCCTQQLLNHRLLNVQRSLLLVGRDNRGKTLSGTPETFKGNFACGFPHTVKGIQQPSRCSKSGSQQITPSPKIQLSMGQEASFEDFGSLVVPRITA